MDANVSISNTQPRGDSNLWQLTAAEIEKATEGFKTVLGMGGFSKVYEGQLYGTDVAVKQLNKIVSIDEPEEKFWKEVSILARLSHPNIMLLIGCCVEERAIVTELMEGGSLQEVLDGNPKISSFHLTWFDRFRISLELASGLLHMHLRGILHRDLKPGNVLLDKHGISKLADVGLAKLTENSHIQTMYSEVRGTHGYVDPHQQVTGELSKESDVYALGLVILQLFMGMAKINEMHRVLEVQPQNKGGPTQGNRELKAILESMNSGIDLDSKEPATIEDLVMKALSRWTQGIDKAVDSVFEKLDPLAGPWPEADTKSILKLALRCVERVKDGRPSLEKEVVPELYGIVHKWKELGKGLKEPDTVSQGSHNSMPSVLSKHSRNNSSLERVTEQEDNSLSREKAMAPRFPSWSKEEVNLGACSVLGIDDSSDGSFGLEMPSRIRGFPKLRSESITHPEEKDPSLIGNGKPPSIAVENLNAATPGSSQATSPETTPVFAPSPAPRPMDQPHWARKVGWLYRQKGRLWESQWEHKFFALYTDPPLLACYKTLAVSGAEVADKTYAFASNSKVVEKGLSTIHGKSYHLFSITGKFRTMTLAVEGKSQLDQWLKELKSVFNEASSMGYKVSDSVNRVIATKNWTRPACIANISVPKSLESSHPSADFGLAIAADSRKILWSSHGDNIYGWKGTDLIISTVSSSPIDFIVALAVHSDQSLWSASSMGILRKWIWNEMSRALICVVSSNVGKKVNALVCSSDGYMWGAHGMTVETWTHCQNPNRLDSVSTFKLHTDAVEDLVAGPDGLVWSASLDGTVRAWVRNQGSVACISCDIGPLVAITITFDGIVWVGGRLGALVAIKDRKFDRKIEGQSIIQPRALVVSPDEMLWSGHEDCSIKAWSGDRNVATLMDHDDSILCLVVGEDGTLWASAEDKIKGWK